MGDLQLPHPVTGDLFPSPVLPGTGWPEDPADPATRVARSPAGVRRLAARADLPQVEARVSVCSACPRLVRWRETVARDKRASYAAEPYWGRPIPGWGDPAPRVLIIGLAPAANGGNRTGRVFTGDPSGDWLFASLHRVGLAVQQTSEHAGDGQLLVGTRMIARVRCAPPDNRPTFEERDACAPWINREVALVRDSVRVVVALGAFGWVGAFEALAGAGVVVPRPLPKFGHGVEVVMGGITLLGCFHPSPRNTFTHRLTAQMTDEVLGRARDLGGLGEQWVHD